MNLIVVLTLQEKSTWELANRLTQGVKKQIIPEKKKEKNFKQVRSRERGGISGIWKRKHLILPTELALGRASDLPQNGLLYATKRTTVCHKTDYRMPQKDYCVSHNGLLYATKRTTVCHKTDYSMPQNGLLCITKRTTVCHKTDCCMSQKGLLYAMNEGPVTGSCGRSGISFSVRVEENFWGS